MAIRKKLKSPQPVKIQVRLPGIVHDLLKQAKKLEQTSMNALIVRFVREAASKSIQKHLQAALYESEQAGTGLFTKPRNPRTNSQKGKH